MALALASQQLSCRTATSPACLPHLPVSCPAQTRSRSMLATDKAPCFLHTSALLEEYFWGYCEMYYSNCSISVRILDCLLQICHTGMLSHHALHIGVTTPQPDIHAMQHHAHMCLSGLCLCMEQWHKFGAENANKVVLRLHLIPYTWKRRQNCQQPMSM